MILALVCLALAPTQDVAAWQARARELAFRGDHDHELLARIEAVAAGAGEQERRELARLARWREALLVTVRHPVPTAEDELTAISISADGRRLATAGTEARVWDTDTGRTIGAPIPLESRASVIALDPTGTRLAVSEGWRRLSVWDVERGEVLLGPLEGGWGEYASLAWSPAGRDLATGSWATDEGDATVYLWDLDRGALRFVTQPFDGDAFHLEISPDGHYVAAEGAGAVWRVADGRRVAQLAPPGHNGISALRFHPREPWVGVAFTDRLRTWDVEAGDWRDAEGFSLDYAPFLAFDDAADRWVVASDRTVLASRRADGRPANHPLVPDDLVDYRESHGWGIAALSPDGTRYARAGLHDTVRVWDTASGARLAPVLTHGASVGWLAFARDGHLMSASRDGIARVWSTASLRQAPAPFDDRGTSVRFAPGGRRGLLLDERGAVDVVDAEGSVLELAGSFPRRKDLAVAANGSRLAGSGFDHRVWTWDLATGREVGAPLPFETSPWGLALDAAGDRLAVNVDRAVRTWDVDRREPLERAVWCGWNVGFDESGALWREEGEEWLAIAAGADGHLEDREGAVDRVDASGGRSRVDTLVSDDVESWIACAGRVAAVHDESVSLLDPAAGRLVARIRHGEWIHRAHAAGGRIATLGEEQLVLWSLTDGAELARWPCDVEVLDAVPIPGTDRVARSSAQHSIVPFEALSGGRTADPWVLAHAPDLVTFPDAGTALVATSEGAVVALDLASGARRTLFERPADDVAVLELSPDGTRLARVDRGGEVVLVDVERGRVLFDERLCWKEGQTLDCDPPPSVAFDPTGSILLVSARVNEPLGDGMWNVHPTATRLIDAASGEVLLSLEDVGSLVERAAFDALGRRLVLASWSELSTWDTATGERLASFSLGESVREVRVHPDEPLVVALGEKGRLGVWELATGRARIAPGTVVADNWTGSLSPDGRRFHGVDEEGIGRVVDLRTGHVLARYAATPWGGLVSPWPEFTFGPDDLVLLDGGRLGRLGAGGLVPIATRRHLPTSAGVLGAGKRRFILDDFHAVVGARPSADGAVPIVLDFGPVRDEPLGGSVDELREEWSRRLGLEVAREGAIVERR